MKIPNTSPAAQFTQQKASIISIKNKFVLDYKLIYFLIIENTTGMLRLKSIYAENKKLRTVNI
jgi:hypothetical protein